MDGNNRHLENAALNNDANLASRNLTKKKDDAVGTLTDDAREAAQSSDDTENQLSSNLITVTLAFVALMATAISTSEVLYEMDLAQEVLILAAMVIFCVSIVAGIANYYRNMMLHKQESLRSARTARRATWAGSSEEVQQAERAVTAALPGARKTSWLLLVQIWAMLIGLVLTVTFVGTLLFITSQNR